MKSKTMKHKYEPFPSFADKRFVKKLSTRKEFRSYIDSRLPDVHNTTHISRDRQFEISSHQKFAKAYLSLNTPYNSVLLYHGVGTGKTCAAIGIAESYREFMNDYGKSSKIIIVASTNVQENFKLQLFDESKLKMVNGNWVFTGCVGNSLLAEINPTYVKNFPKTKIIQYINSIISSNYIFLGYTKFAMLIDLLYTKDPITHKELKQMFNGSTVIIDEYHNMRDEKFNSNSTSGKVKLSSDNLVKFVDFTDEVRLVLLSATPIFNSYKEIIYTLNILLKNDKRPIIHASEIFQSDGTFTPNGKQKLIDASRGYISFVAGDDPSTFPYKIYPPQYPDVYHPKYSPSQFPTIQYNNLPIEESTPENSSNKNTMMTIFNHLITIVSPEPEQVESYEYIMNSIVPTIDDSITSKPSGFEVTMLPVEALNICYPLNPSLPPNYMAGSDGFYRIVSYAQKSSTFVKYQYNPSYKGFFNPGTETNPGPLKKYSCKMYNICCQIKKATGIVLVYSKWLPAGLIPLAMALEEMGINNYTSNLLEEDTSKITNNIGSYCMITGDPKYTPAGISDIINVMTSKANMYGEQIKVILINDSGAEGIDFKNVRQVHILEPWHNTSRLEQIIGRGVRNFSHADLPVLYRNVEVFLYGTIIPNSNKEPMDLYIYRSAEHKAVIMGKVTRLLKQSAIDCIINKGQQERDHEKLVKRNMGFVTQTTASNHRIPNVKVGYTSYSSICDFMESCSYDCIPDNEIGEDETDIQPIEPIYIFLGIESIIVNITELFLQSPYYTFEELYNKLTIAGNYQRDQVRYALTTLITNKIPITDTWGRNGTVVNIGDYYLFQPVEINTPGISFFDRIHALTYKPDMISMDISNVLPPSVQFDSKTSINSTDTIDIIKYELMQIYKYYQTPERVQSSTLPNIRLYMYIGTAMFLLKTILTKMHIMDAEKKCEQIAVSIYIDRLLYSSKVTLIESVVNGSFQTSSVNEYYTDIVVNYINSEYIHTYRGIQYVVLYDYNIVDNEPIQKLFIFEDNTHIVPITSEDNYDLVNIIEEGIRLKCIQTINRVNTIDTIGFWDYKTNPPGYEFKIQDQTNNRSSGRTCSTILLSNIHQLIPENMAKIFKTIDIFGKKLQKEYICMLTMFIFRYLNKYLPYELYMCIQNKTD
jgi:hypothetical protein